MINNLRQKHVEAFFAALRGVEADKLSSPEYSGAVARAAVKAGIVITEIEVDEMKPGEVLKLARDVNAKIVEVLTIDPN